MSDSSSRPPRPTVDAPSTKPTKTTPQTPPPKQTLALDPQTAKLMKNRKGEFPKGGAMDKVNDKFNLKEAEKNDKGKVKLEDDARDLYKALVDEQLTKPKKERISEKRLQSIAQALSRGETVVSDDPGVQELVGRYKGQSMGTQKMLDDSGVEKDTPERNKFERDQMVNAGREGRRMYSKDRYSSVKRGMKQVASLGGYGAWQSHKERRAQERMRNQHGLLQQMGRQPEDQRTHTKMQDMQRQIDEMQQMLSSPQMGGMGGGMQGMGGGRGQQSMYPPSPMSRGQQGMDKPMKDRDYGQFGFMGKPMGAGKATRSIHDDSPSQGTDLSDKMREKAERRRMDRSGFDQGGYDDQNMQAMGQDQQMQMFVMQMMQQMQQLQQQIADMQEKMQSKGKDKESPEKDKGVLSKVESPQPKKVEDPSKKAHARFKDKIDDKPTQGSLIKDTAKDQAEQIGKSEKITGKKMTLQDEIRLVGEKRQENMRTLRDKNKNDKSIGGM